MRYRGSKAGEEVRWNESSAGRDSVLLLDGAVVGVGGWRLEARGASQCSGGIEVGLAGSTPVAVGGSGLRLLRFRLSVRARDGPRVPAMIGDALLAVTIISGT